MCTQRGLESQVELGVHAKEGEELDVYGEGSCNSYNALACPPTVLPSPNLALQALKASSQRIFPVLRRRLLHRNVHNHGLVRRPPTEEADGTEEQAK